MGVLDSLNRILRGYPEEGEDDYNIDSPQPKQGSRFGSSANGDPNSEKIINIRTVTQLQVALHKPENLENITQIADALRDKRTVVLNLESANQQVKRRCIDFLSGVAYAIDGTIKKAASDTYVITPASVNLVGDLIDDLESSGEYLR